MATNRKWRVGLIGCGKMGSNAHMGSIEKLGLELAAVCDKDVARAQALVEERGLETVEIFEDHRDLLKTAGLDLAIVATPPFLHASQSIDAMEAGMHVVCEKPAVMDLAEAKAVLETSTRTDRHIAFLSARMRSREAVGKAIEMKDAEAFGKIHYADVRWVGARGRPGIDKPNLPPWFGLKKTAGGGVLYDLGQYHLDYILLILGWPEVLTVSANWEKRFPVRLAPDRKTDLEGHIQFLARLADGSTLRCTQTNYANMPFENSARVIGSEGGWHMDHRSGCETFRRNPDKGGGVESETFEVDRSIERSGNDLVVEGVLRAAVGEIERSEYGTNAEQAYYLTELCQMAYRSAELGREVDKSDL